MGKVVGLIGSVSGKVGNVVYAVQNGIQTARVYNPSVSNPKSAAQTSHRAKMALAGRLSGLLTPAAISGMAGSNKRAKRGDFIRETIRKATSFDGVSAKIQPADIMFAKGTVGMYDRDYQISVVQSQTATKNVNVNVTIGAGPGTINLRPAGYGERIVVLAINTETSNFDYAQTVVANLPQAGGTVVNTLSFYIPVEMQPDYSFYVYAIPFIAEGVPESSSYSFLGNDDGIVVIVGERVMATPIQYGASIYEGVGSIQA